MLEINWINNFGPNGYGICGRRYVEILHKLGYPIKITPVPYISPTDPLSKLVDVELENPLDIYHAIPTFPQEAFYTVTEVRKPPDYMNYALDQSNFIMTQSEFCKKTFSRITDSEKIHVVNFPFPNSYNPDGPNYILKTGNEFSFKFMTVARIDVRKNPTMLFTAFAEELGNEKDVCLVAKLGSDRYCIPKMFYDMKLPKNILWMRDFVPDTTMLYRSMDAYVCADNGEGWGAPTTEAMLCGLPTIAPRHSGHLDYMDDNNSYLVEVGDWEHIGFDYEHQDRLVNLYPNLLAPMLEWKVPKIDSLKKQIAHVYETYKDIPKRERRMMPLIKNSIDVRKIVSEKYVGRQLMEALNWYEAEHR